MHKTIWDEDAADWEVIDLDTGLPIPDVLDADDEARMYVQREYDERGRVRDDGFLIVANARIELRKKVDDGRDGSVSPVPQRR